MKIGYISYDEHEVEVVKGYLQNHFPNLILEILQENRIYSYTDVLNLLNAGHDIILMHLSQPNCLSLKIAEICRIQNLSTKIVILSGTKVNPQLMNELFDGFIKKPNELPLICQKIKEVIDRPREKTTYEAIMKTILNIIMQDYVLQNQIERAIGVRYKNGYSIDDYEQTVKSRTRKSIGIYENFDVFISYSENDSRIAFEIGDMFEAENLSYFMARRSITPGDLWDDAIKNGLINSKEIIVLITPNSINSSWVLLEIGAAWILNKNIIPCLSFVKTTELPSAISIHQVKILETTTDKKDLVMEIKHRLKATI